MENMKLRHVKSRSFNPWYNLSLEEYLLENIKKDEIILYLWQNENTVVIGRNQNAWKECAWQQLEEDGGKLARRLSGGGAVYHDLGNLNFTFIMNKEDYNLEKQHSVIIDALSKFNVKADFSGRNDMLIDGKKFSGHAYYTNNDKSYHHGTLMVNSDLEKLGYYLKPSEKKIKSKGIDSVRSRVTNIADTNSEVTIEKLKASMDESFCKIYTGECTYEIYELEVDPLIKIYDKYSSWEWRFGHSPKFDISYSEKFAWGEFELQLSLKNGEIDDCKIYTDVMDAELFNGLEEKLKGCLLKKDMIKNIIVNFLKDENIKNDLSTWIDILEM
nr:lipoate--protein ligase [Sedimentibacter sp.]